MFLNIIGIYLKREREGQIYCEATEADLFILVAGEWSSIFPSL
jgi:hypothetical protein